MTIQHSEQSTLRLTINQQLMTTCASVLVICLSPLLIWLGTSWQINLMVLLSAMAVSMTIAYCLGSNLNKGISALEIGLLNFKDGEFSNQVAYQKHDELGHLCQLYNQTAQQLRQEKQWIYQRELMLDKVLQSSPQALLLVDDKDTVIFSNFSGRDLLHSQTALEGLKLDNILAKAPPQLAEVFRSADQGLFQLSQDGDEGQTWHLATGNFLLNNQQHTLYIFKQLTREISRQEVTVWKKVIRIISHELNNSLAPMSSMLHSGRILSKGLDEPRLERVFATIEDRITHLNEFVQGYGKFAKLPPPKFAAVNWRQLSDDIKQHWHFELAQPLPSSEFFADQMQLEQLLINLLKNAHESGSDPAQITLAIKPTDDGMMLTIQDSGSGMSDAVMNNALVPFYSTKTTGSGLGLALCREIAEAHQGHLSLHNHKIIAGQPTGLLVKVFIPDHRN